MYNDILSRIQRLQFIINTNANTQASRHQALYCVSLQLRSASVSPEMVPSLTAGYSDKPVPLNIGYVL